MVLFSAPIFSAVKLEYEGKQSNTDGNGNVTSNFPTKETVYISNEEDIEMPLEKLRPPEDYREVPFDLARWTGIGVKPGRRAAPRDR